MNRILQSAVAAATTVMLAAPVSADVADMKLKISGVTAGALQFMTHDDNTKALQNPPWGLQSAVGNMYFDAKLAEGVDMSFELYLSSKHHQGELWDREGYVYIAQLPFDAGPLNTVLDHIDVKAGHFEVDFGNQHLVRSDNGQVQENPLVGNYIVDVNTVEPGIELIGNHPTLKWVAGISTGTTTGDFRLGRGTAFHGKVGVETPHFGTAVSGYAVDHADNETGFPNNGSYSALFAGNRSGGRYEGIIGGGPEPGQIKPGRGQDVTAVQLDARASLRRLGLSGMAGWTKDADANGSEPGSPNEEWLYYGVEAKYGLTDRLYVAGRYNAAQADMYRGTDSNARIDRFQGGVGVWIVDGVLWKGELVHHRTDDFGADPEFSGFISEVSVAF